MNSSEYCVVYITAGSEEEAVWIAKLLVEQRLAACVTRVSPVISVYRWKGEIESASEILLIAKTRSDKFEALRDAVRKVHSYEVPEIIAIPITDGNPDYLNWIGECTEAENE